MSNSLSELDLLEPSTNESHSNLSVELSESISVGSTISSGSSYQQMKNATTHQQEKLYENGKQLRMLYMDFHCGNISKSQLRDGISDLQIQETGELTRLLDSNNGNLPYSKFLLALTHLNEEDMEVRPIFNSPVKATTPSSTPFATVQDVLLAHQPNESKQEKNDILTWSTPSKQNEQSTRKKKVETSYKASPIPTYESPSYTEPKPIEFKEETEEQLPPFTPQERNKLIQAYLSNSVSANTFVNQLVERCNITPSEQFEKLISEKENGKNVKFLDLVKEVAKLLENVTFTKIEKPKIVESTTRATVNIFDMANAPEENRSSIPHSKEQLPEKRQQRNLFTWDHKQEHSVLPSRKLGVGAYSGSNDIFNRTPEPVSIKPVSKVVQQSTAATTSGDIFSWTTPPKQEEPIQRKKRTPNAAGGGISSIPWGTEDDYFTEENPHSHNLVKRNV